MNNLDSNICQYCDRSISSLEKTVACNYCGKIYHEKCWIDNGGCSTINCNGNVTKLGVSFNASNDSKRMLKDNLRDNERNASFKNTPVTNTSLENLYIGKKTVYYSFKFEQMRNNNTSFSWNWAAFLLSPAWIIYRKMYRLGFGLLIVAHILQLLLGDMFLVYSLIVGIYMGVKGNSLYMSKIEKLIKDSSSMSKLAKTEHVNKNGGVSVKALIISLILSLAIAYMML